jgi:sensor histidine kinase regulating citrate/malate metabolism
VAIVGLLVVAPLLLVEGVLLQRIAKSERETMEQSATSLAREVRDTIDRDLQAGKSALLAHLIWQEHDGPVVERPQRKGFGTILIEGVVSDLGGRLDVDYDPQGLVLKAVVPLPSAHDGMSRL